MIGKRKGHVQLDLRRTRSCQVKVVALFARAPSASPLCSLLMLQADKQVLLAGVKRNALELRQRELEFQKAEKATRESQFQLFSKERMGDTGSHAKDLAKASEAELMGITAACSANKAAVIDLLLKSVKTVSA